LQASAGRNGQNLEYSELLEKSRFQLTRVVPTESAVSVVEALPV